MNINTVTSQKYGEYKAKTPETSKSSAFNDALNNALGFTKSASEIKTASSSTPQTQELNTSLRPGLSPLERNGIYQELDKLATKDKLEQAMFAFLVELTGITQGTIQVPVGKNELAGLMEEMEKAAANCESLESVLQKQIDKHTSYGSIPENVMTVDTFDIDVKTGEIKWVGAKINKSPDKTMEDISRDDDIVWDLAYDLQQFMRYTFFKSEDDDPEEVAQILADIKARQANKNYDRFDNVGTDITDIEEETDDDNKPDEPEDLIDGFIKTIGEHQDKLYDEAHKGTAVTDVEYNDYVYGELEKLMAV